MNTWNKVVLHVIGLSSLLLLGCDPSVKTTILSGLQSGATSIVTALITAAFQKFSTTAA